ncbi:steroid 17-alpha-hydroxylase/17,20 lyase-like [Montipora capricornis]|uniref:steroid 17-alpha-hydroxylase/17,20 lyase-like n=1 Tax=Montipora capricornis TaxID=246305 RepID=UPI0035F21A4D
MALWEYLTFGNTVLALVFLLMLNQLIELYQFRYMPPGPRLTSLPFIGNLLSFDSVAPGKSFLESTSSLRKKYGSVYSLKLGSYKFVLAEDAASVKEVLVKKSADYAGRPPFYSFLLETMGGKDIALGNYGPAWRFHRRLFITAVRQYLSNQHLLEEMISKQATMLLQYFEGQNGRDFDPGRILMQSVANVICHISFGDHFDSSHPDFDELLHLNNMSFTDTELASRVFILDLFPLTKYLPFKAYQTTKTMADRIFEILGKELAIQQKNFDPTAEVKSLIQMLIKERNAAECEIGEHEKSALLSDEYVLNTLGDMFSAGYETTSTTLRWVIAYLVNNPECQTEIQDQIDKVVGRGRIPRMDDNLDLPLIKATVLEALRLGNIAETAIPHYTLKDTSLGKYRVPKDTVVITNLQCVHLDPNCWENPNIFNPHRHIDSGGNLITNSGNFLPFSAGRRVCAGEALAKVELFLFVSWMVHKFTFLPSVDGSLPDLKGISGFTRFPAPYKIRVLKRW